MSAKLPEKRPLEKVTKIDAARRQLATALTLWFKGGDTVSIYTLSHAACEIIHNSTQPCREKGLLFDSALTYEEHRKGINTLLREPANFFKHARRGKAENPTTEFDPTIVEMFFQSSIQGLLLTDIALNHEELAYLAWRFFLKITEEGHYLRTLKRSQFFDCFIGLRWNAQRR